MSRTTRSVFTLITLALCSLPVGAGGAAAQASSPTIDFGSHFHFRTISNQETRGDSPVGLVEFELAARVMNGAGGDVAVSVSQRGAELARFSCPVETRGRQPMTRCNSERLVATSVDPARPVEVRAVHVHRTTDAETVLYQASFPVVQYWSWVGNDSRGRPQHVEQRALRLDSALGAAVARQADFGRSVGGGGEPVVTNSAVQFAWWDARGTNERLRADLRCRVGDGPFQAFRVSGPGTRNDAQEVRNRVRTADGELHEGEGETLSYQEYILTVYDLPFWVQGSETTITSPDTSANGTWICELRTGTGTDRRVLRAFTFDVVDNALRGHAATSQLSLDAGSAVVALGFDAQALPAAFDPELVRSGFFGMPWSNPASAPLFGTLPTAAVLPSFSTPPGVRVARPTRPTRHASR